MMSPSTTIYDTPSAGTIAGPGKFMKAVESVLWECNLNLTLFEAVEEGQGPRLLIFLPPCCIYFLF